MIKGTTKQLLPQSKMTFMKVKMVYAINVIIFKKLK